MNQLMIVIGSFIKIYFNEWLLLKKKKINIKKIFLNYLNLMYIIFNINLLFFSFKD